MKLLITGGTGFVGQVLIKKALMLGHDIVVLTRHPHRYEMSFGGVVRYLFWDGRLSSLQSSYFDGVEGIINLMGEGIATRRWTEKQKKKIFDSRVSGTKHLVLRAKQYAKQLKVFVSASAVGYYDHIKSQVCDEDGSPSASFLGDLCQRWEHESEQIKSNDIREVRFRIGVVLGHGGALKKMALPFKLCLGGVIGSGHQRMNWIHCDDLVSMLLHSLSNQSVSGAYNAVSPENDTNVSFSKCLAKVLGRPCFFKVPRFMLKLLLGEMACVVLEGQRVSADKILGTGFSFKYASLQEALKHSLNFKKIKHLSDEIQCERLDVWHWLPLDRDQVFDFFSDAYNLEAITPSFLKFRVLDQSTAEIQEGTIFNYKLRLRGVPVFWRSLICEWIPLERFVDTQLKGPYRVWHHTHTFYSYKEGTLIRDVVYYAMPRIPLMATVVLPFVSKDVYKIFQYRKNKINELLVDIKDV